MSAPSPHAHATRPRWQITTADAGGADRYLVANQLAAVVGKTRRAVDKAPLRSFDRCYRPAVQHHDFNGHLTLNVLLSFAQFERADTGERIRDKIAASKCKCSRWVVHLKLHRLRHACYIDVMKTTAMYVAITILIGSLGATRSAVFVPDSVAPTPPPQIIVQPPLRLSCNPRSGYRARPRRPQKLLLRLGSEGPKKVLAAIIASPRR